MFDAVKRTMYASLGLAMLTKDKASEMVQQLVERGELTELQAEELVNDIRKQGQDFEKEVTSSVDAAVASAINKMNLATKEDVRQLHAKLDEMISRRQTSPGEPDACK